MSTGTGTASMLDEIKVPEEKEPKLWTCPCCKFSFRGVDLYAEHLMRMRASIDDALKKAGRTP